MRYEILHLKDFFPALGENGRDATLAAYLPDNLTEMGRDNEAHPSLLICPGGAYCFCSQREAEPIALHFLPEGFNVFILYYSVNPYRFPVQLCEVAAAMELIHKNAAAWHCDTARTAIMGFSAAAIWRRTIPRRMTARRCGAVPRQQAGAGVHPLLPGHYRRSRVGTSRQLRRADRQNGAHAGGNSEVLL